MHSSCVRRPTAMPLGPAMPRDDSHYATMSSAIGGFYNRPLEVNILDKEGYSGFLPEEPGPQSPEQTLESAKALTSMWREQPPPPVWTIDDGAAYAGTPSHSAAATPERQRAAGCGPYTLPSARSIGKSEVPASPHAYDARDVIEGYAGHRSATPRHDNLGSSRDHLYHSPSRQQSHREMISQGERASASQVRVLPHGRGLAILQDAEQ